MFFVVHFAQAIWIRSRRKMCFLCARYFHSDCRSSSVVLVKPSIGPDKVGRRVKCCLECSKNHSNLEAFAAFRNSFDRQLKIDILFGLYKKLRQSIAETLHAFGSLVIRFVEQSHEASKEEYASCRSLHAVLTSLYQQLTKMFKKMTDATFGSAREEQMAKNLRVCIADWISDSLSQLRALEISWKKVVVRSEVRQKQQPVVERKANAPKIASISPVVIPLQGCRVAIFGECLDPASIEVSVENIPCRVECFGPTQAAVWAPAMSEEGPRDVRLKQKEVGCFVRGVLVVMPVLG